MKHSNPWKAYSCAAVDGILRLLLLKYQLSPSTDPGTKPEPVESRLNLHAAFNIEYYTTTLASTPGSLNQSFPFFFYN